MQTFIQDSLPFFSTIFVFAAAQALMSVILLLANLKTQPSNLMLALWCGAWGASCFFIYSFFLASSLFIRPVMTFVGPLIPITLYPPLYLYVKHLFFEHKKFVSDDLYHFIPAAVYLLFSMYLFVDSSADVELMRKHELYHSRSLLVSYITAVQGLLYFFWIRKVLKKQEIKLKQVYSDIEEIKLDWVSVINNLNLPVLIFGNLSAIVKGTHWDPVILYIAYHVFMTISLFFVSYKLIFNPIYLTGQKIEMSPKNVFEVKTVHSQVPIKIEKASYYEKIIVDLQNLMIIKPIYRNHEVCLQDLANELSISRNDLSHALNHSLNKSFYDYINELRIEDCKRQMKDPKSSRYSIIAIAFDAGFKSKTVFYKIFKQMEGVTPSEYRAKLHDLGQAQTV